MTTEGAGTGQDVPLSTKLALDRTRLAHDRTLLAWVRTATSLISFGFTIYKFLSYLKGSETIHAHNPEGPRYLGLLLTGLGSVSLAAGIVQYMQMLRQIGAVLRYRVAFYVAWVVVGLGFTILLGMATRRGPF